MKDVEVAGWLMSRWSPLGTVAIAPVKVRVPADVLLPGESVGRLVVNGVRPVMSTAVEEELSLKLKELEGIPILKSPREVPNGQEITKLEADVISAIGLGTSMI
jgi:hypothetical protein